MKEDKVVYKMPANFRWKLDCLVCPSSLSADGHDSMACMDAWLSAHLAGFGHCRYSLTIIPEQKCPRVEMVEDLATRTNELLNKFKADDITSEELKELSVCCEWNKKKAVDDGDILMAILNAVMLALIESHLALLRSSRRQKHWYQRLFGL